MPTPPDSSSPSLSFEARYEEDTTRSSISPEQLTQIDWDIARNLEGRDKTEEYTEVREIGEAEGFENTPKFPIIAKLILSMKRNLIKKENKGFEKI
ncbi:hypothetical protein ACHAO8_011359 [Botrytis cinerea]